MNQTNITKRLATFKDKKFTVVKVLSLQEQADIEIMFKVINGFEVQNKNFEIVTEIYQDILNTLNQSSPDHQLFRQIMEFVSTFNAFLNHWNTYLIREFGKTSKNYLAFKESTGEQFDKVFGYRFLYGLRNYIHHCGMPNIIIHSKLGQKEELIHELIVDQEELKVGMDWHKTIKKDFESMPNKFDIFPYLKDLIKSISAIHKVAINNMDMVRLLLCAKKMLAFKEFRGSEDNELVFLEWLEFNGLGKPTNFNFVQFRFNLAEYLVRQINPII